MWTGGGPEEEETNEGGDEAGGEGGGGAEDLSVAILAEVRRHAVVRAQV